VSRRLRPEDEALWREVTRSVKPLGERRAAPDQPRPRYRPRPMVEEIDPPAARAIPGSIDRKARKQLARGRDPIDRVLDLHGLTQDRAYALLRRTIVSAHQEGVRTLLVITGKGGKRFAQTDALPAAYRTRAQFEPEGGVLKRRVPQWLETPELAPFVQATGEAADAHGGRGALYVRLRRRR